MREKKFPSTEAAGKYLSVFNCARAPPPKPAPLPPSAPPPSPPPSQSGTSSCPARPGEPPAVDPSPTGASSPGPLFDLLAGVLCTCSGRDSWPSRRYLSAGSSSPYLPSKSASSAPGRTVLQQPPTLFLTRTTRHHPIKAPLTARWMVPTRACPSSSLFQKGPESCPLRGDPQRSRHQPSALGPIIL